MRNLNTVSSVSTQSSLNKSLIRNLGIKPNAVERSMTGFREFLKTIYVKKKGVGNFTSIDSYECNLNLFLKTIGLDSFKWHRMSRVELIQQAVRFSDVDSRGMRSDYVRNINATVSAYMDYTRHTFGLYKPTARTAA